MKGVIDWPDEKQKHLPRSASKCDSALRSHPATAVCVGMLLLMSLASTSLMAIEKASYTVLKTDGELELRDYEPQLVVETVVESDLEEASSQAFRLLFDYISGENRAQEKIEMTAPVSQDAATGPEKIEMTGPVSVDAMAEGTWRVNFLVPSRYSMETAPAPLNPKVQLRAIPAQRMAAVRYSGRWTRKKYQENLTKLDRWIEQQGLKAIGEPVWARYDPPFKPWFMRRNEILVPVARDPASRKTATTASS